MNSSLQEYLERLAAEFPENQRFGQWAFNLLQEERPELAEQIRGSDLDPFHDDSRMHRFLSRLVTEWRS